MALVEYLYVDEKRLDSYFEQISSPVTYDKVPEWSAEISLTGPKAGAKQPRHSRPYALHEKISKLTKHLEDEGMVRHGRASGPEAFSHTEDRGLFRIETCQARRVSITRVSIPTMQLDSSPGNLSLWISLMDRSPWQASLNFDYTIDPSNDPINQPGNLYLLEDDGAADTPSRGAFSVYSLLDMLLIETQTSAFAGNASHEGINLDLWRAFGDQEFRRDFLRRFSVDPTVALSQLGAQVGPPRRIRSLYRVRATFQDSDAHQDIEAQFCIATFGYPIFIAEDTDPI